jgi:hypothetical protein
MRTDTEKEETIERLSTMYHEVEKNLKDEVERKEMELETYRETIQ